MLPGLLFIDPVISNPYQNFVDNTYNPSWTFLVYSTAGWAIKGLFFVVVHWSKNLKNRS